MKQFTNFTTEYKQQTGRNFLMKMVPLEASKSKVYLDKQQMPRISNLGSIDYTPGTEITVELHEDFNMEVAREILSQLDLNFKMKPAYQRWAQGYDQETGVYDDDNDDDQTNNDGAFENWYSRNGAFAKAALSDNDEEAYRIAFKEINWSECNFEELADLFETLGCEVNGAEEQVYNKSVETVVCSKLYFHRDKYKTLQVPNYIKGQVLYREAIGAQLKKFIEEVKELIQYDKLSLTDKLQLGTTFEVKDWNDGLAIKRAHDSVIRNLRPWLAEQFEKRGGITVTTVSEVDTTNAEQDKQLESLARQEMNAYEVELKKELISEEMEIPMTELLDMRINDYLSEALESITELENISDSLKLNPLSEAEYQAFPWVLKFPWIQWRTIKASDIKTENTEKVLTHLVDL